MNRDDTQLLFTKALRGEKLTDEEAAYVAQVAQDNTDFRRRLEKIEANITKIGMGALGLILTNFFNDFFGHLLQ